MDFDEKLGDLVDDALGLGGVEIDDVIAALKHQLNEARLLKAEAESIKEVDTDED